MTLEEFLKALEGTERKWEFRIGDKGIILVLPDLQEGRFPIIRDPLTAVASAVMRRFFAINSMSDVGWIAAGKALNLEAGLAGRIFDATYRLAGYEKELRTKLEQATGLT